MFLDIRLKLFGSILPPDLLCYEGESSCKSSQWSLVRHALAVAETWPNWLKIIQKKKLLIWKFFRNVLTFDVLPPYCSIRVFTSRSYGSQSNIKPQSQRVENVSNSATINKLLPWFDLVWVRYRLWVPQFFTRFVLLFVWKSDSIKFMTELTGNGKYLSTTLLVSLIYRLGSFCQQLLRNLNVRLG